MIDETDPASSFWSNSMINPGYESDIFKHLKVPGINRIGMP